MKGVQIVKRGINVQNRGYSVDVPDACPSCHRHGEMGFVFCDVVKEGSGVQAIFRCSYQRCRSFFICSYGPLGSTDLLAVHPLKAPESTFSDAVKALSPTFVTICARACDAKHLGLDQIAGPGFRKAFEFLIKDYAKSLDPTKASAVEAALAGKGVKDFIADARILRSSQTLSLAWK